MFKSITHRKSKSSSESKHKDPFDAIPIEVMGEVFKFLSLKDIVQSQLVSRSWRRCIHHDEESVPIVWHELADKVFRQFFWMFDAFEVVPIQSEQYENLLSIDDEHIVMNSPLKTTTSASKFQRIKPVSSENLVKLSPDDIIEKYYHLKCENYVTNLGAALLPSSLAKQVANCISSSELTISMWFHFTTSLEGGVLFGVQNQAFPQGTAFVPIIYIPDACFGSTIRAGFWGENFMEIEKTRFEQLIRVEQWNHVALTRGRDGASLYLNGTAVQTIRGQFNHHEHHLYYAQIGSGLCDGWPGTNMDYGVNCYTFKGRIADVNIWSREMKEEDIRMVMTRPRELKSLIGSWSMEHVKNKKVKGTGGDLDLFGQALIISSIDDEQYM